MDVVSRVEVVKAENEHRKIPEEFLDNDPWITQWRKGKMILKKNIFGEWVLLLLLPFLFQPVKITAFTKFHDNN